MQAANHVTTYEQIDQEVTTGIGKTFQPTANDPSANGPHVQQSDPPASPDEQKIQLEMDKSAGEANEMAAGQNATVKVLEAKYKESEAQLEKLQANNSDLMAEVALSKNKQDGLQEEVIHLESQLQNMKNDWEMQRTRQRTANATSLDKAKKSQAEANKRRIELVRLRDLLSRNNINWNDQIARDGMLVPSTGGVHGLPQAPSLCAKFVTQIVYPPAHRTAQPPAAR